MTVAKRRPAPLRHALALAALALAACGGGGSNPLTNPDSVQNTSDTQTARKLSFAFFQKCVNPIVTKPITIGGVVTANNCANSGCHDYANGTGNSFKVIAAAAPVDLSNVPNLSDSEKAAIRATDIYKNYYSAQGVVIVGAALRSLLLDKPLVLNALHGGGQILPDTNDENVKTIKFWIEHPVANGQDEFSVAAPACAQP